MGIVADTSVFTLMERKQWTALQAAEHLANLHPDEAIVISSIAAAELVHGLYRAATDAQFRLRSAYVEAILQYYPIAPFDAQEAWAAGRMRGEQAMLGNTLPFADSYIAATAMALKFSVLTHNVKDFTRIPGLQVIPFLRP